jgi:uncharacterized delta-60 repeat protein
VGRYNADGGLDASFGGGGYVLTAFTGVADAHAVAVQADGKIVVAGGVAYGTAGHSDFALARYNPDGSLDTGFGSGGTVLRGLGLPFGGADAIALQPDGRIVVGGYALNVSLQQFLLVRYNTDGSLDRTFAPAGVASRTSPDFGTAQGVGVLSDGTVVAVATAGDGLAVVSYAPNGRRDVAFTALGPNAAAAGLAVGPDGKVVAAGYFGTGAYSLVVARYLNQGPPPPVFVVGTDGSVSGENSIAPRWATLSPAGTILSISAVTDAGGISDVFAITTTGNSLYERAEFGWVRLSDGYFQQISATTDAAGNAVVFGVLGAGAGAYANSLWDYHNGGWSQRTGFGLPVGVRPADVQYVSAVHTAQGEEAFVIAADATLWGYTPAGGWQQLSTGSFQQVSARLNGAGQAVVYGVLGDGSVWEQDPAFGTVGLDSGWRELSGAGGAPASFLSVAAGGPDKVFGVAADRTLWEHSASGWAELSVGSFANVSARQAASGRRGVRGAHRRLVLGVHQRRRPAVAGTARGRRGLRRGPLALGEKGLGSSTLALGRPALALRELPPPELLVGPGRGVVGIDGALQVDPEDARVAEDGRDQRQERDQRQQRH